MKRLLGIAALAGLLAACGGSEPRRPDVVMVLADTVRADRLGAYGHPGGLTPTLDAVAREGVLFERVVAQAPWTQPSVASLFSAVYPGVHQVLDYDVAFSGALAGQAVRPVLDARFTTLAEALRSGGYATAAFVANPFVKGEFGFAQGFDHFDASFATIDAPGSAVNEALFAWLDRRDDRRPLFLYLHYMDAHGPYDADPELLEPLLEAVEAAPDKRELTPQELERLHYLRRPPSQPGDPERHRRLEHYREYWVARYEAGVRQLDRRLAALRTGLEQRGLWQRAYLVVTSDHGEALLEHGLWDHGFSVADPELHVPLLLRWPGVLPAGLRVPSPVRLIDLGPTLLEQLGLPALAGAQGLSFAARLRGEPAADAPAALAEAVKAGPEQKALYRGRYKLVQVGEGSGVRQRLFDLAADPDERVDAGPAAPEELAGLRRALGRQLAENRERARQLATERRAVSEQERRRLEELGYLPGLD